MALEKLNDIPKDSSDAADETVVREMVTTFSQSSDFEEYIDDSTFETTVTVITDLINRDLTEQLMAGDSVFNSDFIKLLGNMFLI